MSIDMSMFLDTFFEESAEGLEIMESGLLEMGEGEVDSEGINCIFRAAHSIKGGAGTFGLMEISNFTHVMETLLDEMRDGRRDSSREVTEALLESVDCLSEMLDAAREKADYDLERIEVLNKRLHAILDPDAAQDGGGEAGVVEDSEEVAKSLGWTIKFYPFPEMMKTGNDPLRMIGELDELGELTAEADVEKVPTFGDFDPEEFFIGWTITLRGEIEKSQVTEVFDWVDGDCDLEITEIVDAGQATNNNIEKVEAVAKTTGETAGEGQDEPVKDEKESPVAEKRVGDRRKKVDRRAKKSASSEATSIRVGVQKIDELVNLMGELVITQSMLCQLGNEEEFTVDMITQMREGLAELERNTRDMQENVMSIRMLPISFSFNRFPRLVHDLSGKLGKKIDLKFSGENTELDKTVMEKIGDPLVHLVRNALDHGIETPEVRVASGKDETGTLLLNAYHQGGSIVIEIVDDGAGLNRERIFNIGVEKGIVDASAQLSDAEVYDLLFQPGFSTAKEVTDVSGRGVGMDVVRRNIRELGGDVDIESTPGEGSTFTIRLPLTLAILDGQLVNVGADTYIIPIVSIIESLQIKAGDLSVVVGQGEVFNIRDEYIPVIRLHEVLGIETEHHELTDGLLVIVEGGGEKVGLFVDDLAGQQQVVIKSLETNFMKVDGISGATILGNGTVALILDIAGLVKLSKDIPPKSNIRLVGGNENVAA